ncbi:MAG: hypothetical protein LC650_04540 [Actinobacteria bacterium]|nr:hypothetical protein [Actinomycetota bacterium]
MTREEKNSKAYDDAFDLAEPSNPNDEEYMEFYRFWRTLARYHDDEWIWNEYIEDR